ncbi:MAG: MBL fold metallo-hydrolase [Atribacterota bacterium]
MTSFIKFLGTAGARIVVSKQFRASGGIWLELSGTAVHIDPGPGALVRALSSRPKLNPEKLAGILLSHRHLDHSNDLNIMVEAMTEGTTRKRGTVFLPADAIEKEPVFFSYLQERVERIVTLEEGGVYQLGVLQFTTPFRHLHSAETYGFTFPLSRGNLSLIVDTLYDDALLTAYQHSRVLVLNTVRLKKDPLPNLQHLCIPDAEHLIREINPELAILTHFGMTIVRDKPWEIAENLSQKTGVRVIAATDGLSVNLGFLEG